MSQSRPRIGNVERIDQEVIGGWAYDPSAPDQRLNVTVYYDDIIQEVLPADGFRSDLEAAGIGDGSYAFTWAVPPHLTIAPHKVAVFVDEWRVPIDEKIIGVVEQAQVAEIQRQRTADPREMLLQSGLIDVEYAVRFVKPDKVAAFREDPASFLLADAGYAIKPHPLFDPTWYKTKHKIASDIHPLLHYVTVGIGQGLAPNYGFQPNWYLSYLAPAAAEKASANPLLHYYEGGWRDGASPHPFFRPSWYFKKHGDVQKAGMEPLAHYLDAGAREGRHIHPLVDPQYYQDNFGKGPVLEHYWNAGITEGRAPHGLLQVAPAETGRTSPFVPGKTLTPLEAWKRFNAPTNKRSLHVRQSMNAISYRPKLSIVMPVYNPPIGVFRDAVNSALTQSYGNFEFIIIDDASTHPAVRQEIEYLAKVDSRIIPMFHEKNTHISQATNDAVDVATGDYIVFLDHDDALSVDALAILAVYIDMHDAPDLLYSDDCRTDLSGKDMQAARFKPAWSPELLLSYSYASHLRAVRIEKYREIGGSRLGYEGSQDHDMFLRLLETVESVIHIPFVLYGRRAVPGSTALAGDEKPYAYNAGIKSVQDSFARRGIEVDVVRPDFAIRAGFGIYKPVMPHEGPEVAIIIPTKNNVRTLIRLLRSLSLTLYKNFTVLIIDNGSDDPETVRYLSNCPFRVERVLSGPDGFNFSRLNNIGVGMVDAEYILFLNDDTEVLAPEWLSQMVGWGRLPGVGAVGARLFFGDRRIQHGGVSPEQTVGYTMFRGLPSNEHGYLSAAVVTRNCAAVTAACLLTPRKLFVDLGGFDEVDFGVAFNDVDYCLRLGAAGKRVVYCAEAELYHHEGSSRPKVDKPAEVANFKRKYADYRDPYLNRNLDRRSNRMDISPTVLRLPGPIDPPKVLFVSHNYNHEGAPNSLFEIVTGLAKRGVIRPTVVGPQAGPLLRLYQEAGIEALVSSSLAAFGRAKTVQDYDVAIEKCVASLSISDYDLVVANTAEMHSAIHAANVADVPSVWIIREGERWSDYYGKLGEEVEVKALQAFSLPYRVIFVSEASYRNWSPLNGGRNFTVITNGLDKQRFIAKCGSFTRDAERRKLGFAKDDVVILAVGGLIPRKGQHDLILSLGLMPLSAQSKIQIIIVGARHNAYHERLMETIEGYPPFLRDRVMIVPETRSIGQYFVSADIFFCGSRMESYPRIILEAELAGLPIVTTPVAGIPEQVYVGVNALFYDPGKIRDLAAILSDLVEDTEKREKMGAASKVVFEALLSYEQMLGQYKDAMDAAVLSSVPTILA